MLILAKKGQGAVYKADTTSIDWLKKGKGVIFQS